MHKLKNMHMRSSEIEEHAYAFPEIEEHAYTVSSLMERNFQRVSTFMNVFARYIQDARLCIN